MDILLQLKLATMTLQLLSMHIALNAQILPVAHAEAIPVVKVQQSAVLPLKRAFVEELIRQKSKEYGVDPELALYLARIESNLTASARNPRSSAKGIYQFIDGTWKAFCEGDVKDAEDNITCAMQMLGEDPRNISHWKADPATAKKLLDAGFI